MGVVAAAAACVLVSVTTTIPAAAASDDWPSFTLDLANSRYPVQSAVTSADVSTLHQLWYAPTPAPVTGTPVVLDGTAYVADWAGDVEAISMSSGAITWSVSIGYPISSTLSLADGLVYVSYSPFDTAEFGQPGQQGVAALSQQDGHTVWQTALPGTMHGILASPTLYNGLLYIGAAIGIGQPDETDPSDQGQIYALDAATGTIVWSTVLAGTAGGAGLWGSVAVDPTRNAIYFGTGNAFAKQGTTGLAYSIVALDASSGLELWHYRAYGSRARGGDHDFGSTPNLFSYSRNGVMHDAVGMSNKDGLYYIVDRDTGKLLERLRMGQGGVGLAGFDPTQSAPTVYVPTVKNPGAAFGGDFTDPAVCCGMVIALSPGRARSVWRAHLLGNAVGSVAVIPGAVLVGTTTGDLYALSSVNGASLAHLSVGAPVDGGVSVAEGQVLVPAGRAFGAAAPTGLYAFSP